ncbi:glycosyltransferase family 4 protein [bacterium]|nr:glycosyltransferase family 4 protein [bacterium]
MPHARIAIGMEYPVGQTGGVEVLVRELARGLADRFEVILVSDDTPASLQVAGLRDYLAGHVAWKFGEYADGQAARLIRTLKAQRVQLIHLHFGGPFAFGIRLPWRSPLRLAQPAGIPCLFTNHWVRSALRGYCGDQRPLWYKLALFPGAWWARLANLQAAAFELTVSRADQAVERGNVFPFGHRVYQLYHSALDADEPLPPEPRQPVILSVGTLDRRKGQDILVSAFCQSVARLPGWRLVVAGRPAPEFLARLQGIVSEHPCGDQVQFTGELTDREVVRRLMGDASIFAMPSRSEGLGLSLQEALFRGLACVGSRVGGIADLIDHERNGLLVPPDDPAALADALVKLAGSPDLRRRLGHAGRRSILDRGMTRQQMVDNHAALYEQLLADPRRRPALLEGVSQ